MMLLMPSLTAPRMTQRALAQLSELPIPDYSCSGSGFGTPTLAQ
jgi:hypothetical protein